MLIGVSTKQGVFAEKIDDPRNASSVNVKCANRILREKMGIRRSCRSHARGYILASLIRGKKRQAATKHHTLAQLAQLMALELLIKLRLTHQDDVHQFAAGGFQIQKQAQFVQGIHGKCLGLINNDHRGITCSVASDQPFVQSVNQIAFLR